MLIHDPAPLRRVVVLGAGGFVGGAVVERLRAEEVPVLGLGRGELDLLAKDAPERLAALLRPEDSLVLVSAWAPCKDAGQLVDNIRMAEAVCTALRQVTPAHLVYISSDAVYGDQAEPLTEASPAAPGSLHGVMHLARELLLRAGYGGPLAILRPTLLYGLSDPHNGYGPNRFRRLAGEGADIVLFGEGEERRDHVLIDDVAALVTRVLTHRSRGILNIATGEVTSFRDIAERTVTLLGSSSRILGSPRQGPMPHNGYRPFDRNACRLAFPDFTYTPLNKGLALTCRPK